MSPVPVIGIDLGTTNSVVSYTDDSGTTHVITDEDGDRIIPSVIHFKDGDEIVVGKRAKTAAPVYPDRVATLFKRGMGEKTHLDDGSPFSVDGKTFNPEELSSIVIAKLASMAEKHFGEKPQRAVITVPHYFGDLERQATKNAGEIAGLEVLRIINEPTAAAIAHGIELDSPQTGKLLVFDLGGGTFDVTIMNCGASRELDVIAGDGDRMLGGADFDQAIYDDMVARLRVDAGGDLAIEPQDQAHIRQQAEEMKKELSSSTSSTQRLIAGGRSFNYELTRDGFERLIEERIEFVEDAVRRALDVEGVGEKVDRVLMVGGSSRIPKFQALVKEITGIEPQLTKNLDEDVSRGAAMLGAKMGAESLDPRSELAQMPSPQDASSHALGIQLIDDSSGLYNEVLIPPHTAVPHSATYPFFTASEGQTMVEIILYEGEDRDISMVRELGRSTGSIGKTVPRGYPLTCEVQWTIEGLVKVDMFDGETGGHIVELKVEREGEMSDAAIAQAQEFLMTSEVS